MTEDGTITTFNGARELWPCEIFNDVAVVDPPPEGAVCIHCEEDFSEEGTEFPVLADSRFGDGAPGVWYSNHVPTHLECFLRGTFGGVNHQKGTCSCCGGSEDPDPPELTTREAARAAVLYYDITRPHLN